MFVVSTNSIISFCQLTKLWLWYKRYFVYKSWKRSGNINHYKKWV